MGIFSKQASELETGESARCGRCAELLPDDTLTYCPSCGVPFWRVPPTTTFHLLSERKEARRARGRQAKFLSQTLLVALAAFASYFGAARITRDFELRSIVPTRTIVFHTHFVEGFPRPEPRVVRESIAIAVQAFEDHFHIPLKRVEIRDDDVPVALREDLDGPWSPDAVRADSPMLLKSWEKRIYPRLLREWARAPYQPLHVVVTNMPIFADPAEATSLELRHLSGAGLISGLGHPSLVVASTFRMLAKAQDFARNGAPLEGPEAQARYLGEYVLAHELGHALLGLNDVVVEAKAHLRAPASANGAGVSFKQCLMHTDEGGGYAAWNEIRRRPLGTPSDCGAYSPIVEGFAIRRQALEAADQGSFSAAWDLMNDAVLRAQSSGHQDWLTQRWIKERELMRPGFASLFRPFSR